MICLNASKDNRVFVLELKGKRVNFMAGATLDIEDGQAKGLILKYSDIVDAAHQKNLSPLLEAGNEKLKLLADENAALKAQLLKVQPQTSKLEKK